MPYKNRQTFIGVGGGGYLDSHIALSAEKNEGTASKRVKKFELEFEAKLKGNLGHGIIIHPHMQLSYMCI